MGGITPEKIGPEARLPRIEIASPEYVPTFQAPLRRAVERYQRVHAQCEAQMVSSEGMDFAFQALDRERREAIQAVMTTSAFEPEDLKAKLQVLKSLHAWCGPDESLVPLVMSLAEEAVAFLSRDDLHDKRAGAPNGWAGPGRWLITAASSVPAFLMDRFGPG